jgi:hypothetical protein
METAGITRKPASSGSRESCVVAAARERAVYNVENGELRVEVTRQELETLS